MDDAGLLTKYGIKSVDEVETGHKILARYGSDAASIGSEQFKAIHVLETRQAGVIDELAGSTHLSGTDDLVKVAQLEQRSEGMASALKNVMNKEGATETVDLLYGTTDESVFAGGKKVISKGKTLDKIGGGELPPKDVDLILRSIGKASNNEQSIRQALNDLGESMTVEDVENLMIKYVDKPGIKENIHRIANVEDIGNVKGSINEFLTADAYENAGYAVNRFSLEGEIQYTDPITKTVTSGHYEIDLGVSNTGGKILADAKSGTLSLTDRFKQQLARLKAMSVQEGAEAQVIVTQIPDNSVLTYIKGQDINVYMRQDMNLIML